MRIKCYVGNLDGTREGCVYATNQQAAAHVAGCSLYSFRHTGPASRPASPSGQLPADRKATP